MDKICCVGACVIADTDVFTNFIIACNYFFFFFFYKLRTPVMYITITSNGRHYNLKININYINKHIQVPTKVDPIRYPLKCVQLHLTQLLLFNIWKGKTSHENSYKTVRLFSIIWRTHCKMDQKHPKMLKTDKDPTHTFVYWPPQ